MEKQQKEAYAEPVLMAHDMLRDITGIGSQIIKLRDECIKQIDAACSGT